MLMPHIKKAHILLANKCNIIHSYILSGRCGMRID